MNWLVKTYRGRCSVVPGCACGQLHLTDGGGISRVFPKEAAPG